MLKLDCTIWETL